MAFFDQFLSKVAPEDRVILDKYPDLKTSVDKLEANYSQALGFANQWADWAKDNWDEQAGSTRVEVELRQQLADLQAAQAGGADQATLDTMKRGFETKLAEAQTNFGQALDGMNNFYRFIVKQQYSHQNEFGQALDPDELRRYMQDNKISNFELAYNQMMSGKRAEVAAAKEKERDEAHKAEVAAAEQRGREAAAREAAMGPGGVQPTDGTGGIAGMTARIAAQPPISDELKARVAEAKPGDGSLAQLGYEMFRQGSFQQQQ